MMNKELTQEQIDIIEIIKRYPDVLKDRRRFVSLIADVLPSNRALQNALVSAYDENIMEEVSRGVNYRQAIYRCSNILEKNTGLAIHYVKQAVEIFIVLFGKEEWFIEEVYDDNESKNISSVSFTEIKKKECVYGDIEYIESNGKIYISNIICSESNLSKSIIIIPEKIDGYEVARLLPDSLNSLRYNKCKYIVIPKTVTIIGDPNNGLYTTFQKQKGVSGKIKIYWAKNNYSEYDDIYEFCSVFADNMPDEINICGTSVKLLHYLNSERFMLINNYQGKNDYWSYPDNDIWVYNDSLVYYSGNSEILHISCCEQIRRGAIYSEKIKEIIFGPSVTKFETAMISNCDSLERIVFEAEVRCKFGELAFSNCKKLNEVRWPKIFNFEQVSIYNNCPQLGNMVKYKRLLTYQSDEKVIVVPSDIEIINNKSFCSCKNATAIIIPKSVERIENAAFEGTTISYVIIEGMYTQWDAQKHSEKDLYVYTLLDSNVMHSVSPFKKYSGLYIKNISCLEQSILLGYDIEKILNECKKHTNQRSDEEMIVMPYSWEKEIHYKD